jgi:hypothetical protein
MKHTTRLLLIAALLTQLIACGDDEEKKKPTPAPMPDMSEDMSPDQPVDTDMGEDMAPDMEPDQDTDMTANPGTARLQVIHASADPAAAVVDIYANGNKLLDDLAFNDGTNFFPVPAGAELKIDITAGNAADNSAPVYTVTVPALAADTNYIAVATGLVGEQVPEAQRLRLVLIPKARTAGEAGRVSVLAFHGVADAPNVDIALDNSAMPAVPDLPFGSFTQSGGDAAYLAVDPTALTFGDVALIDVRAAASDAFVAGFQTPGLTPLVGGAAVIAATGSLEQGTFGLRVFLASQGDTPTKQPGSALPQAARLQVIHNAADPAAASVDVYANAVRILDNFAFRTASPYLTVPSGVDLTVDVAGPDSMSNASPIKSFPGINLAAGSKTVAVASGVVDPSKFATTVNDAAAVAFTLVTFAGDESAAADTVDVKVVHGSTDAPEVGVQAATNPDPTPVVPAFSYKGVAPAQGYAAIPSALNARLQITAPNSTNPLFQTTDPVNFAPFAGKALVALASGFLDPSKNQSGPAFAILAVLPDGTAVTIPVSAAAP